MTIACSSPNSPLVRRRHSGSSRATTISRSRETRESSAMTGYDRLGRGADQRCAVKDHGAEWHRLEPVGAVNGTLRERLETFCATKRITLDALAALGTRVDTTR